MKKNSLSSPEAKRKISLLAEIASYGMEWVEGSEEPGHYITGSTEATAHIVACCMTQWFDFVDCADTGEVRDMLFPKFENPSVSIYEKRIKKFLQGYLDFQKQKDEFDELVGNRREYA